MPFSRSLRRPTPSTPDRTRDQDEEGPSPFLRLRMRNAADEDCPGTPRLFLRLRAGVPIDYRLDQVDADNPLDLVPHHARPIAMAHAMTNSFGFGGTNASLIFKRRP